MAIKPILFSTPMVQAIMDGRKSMTRRIIKGASHDWNFLSMEEGSALSMTDKDGNEYPQDVEGLWATFESEGWPEFPMVKSKYQVGDVLWVRQTWAKISDYATPDTLVGLPDGFLYKASGEYHMGLKWRPSIFMPKEACRLFLRVTAVRADRLREITVDDCRNEGACCSDCYEVGEHSPSCKCDTRFQNLWDSLNAKRGYGWDTNPWVWVISFERCDKPKGWCA